MSIPILHIFQFRKQEFANLKQATLRQRVMAQLIDGIILGAVVSLWLVWMSGGKIFSLWISPVIPVYFLQVSPHWFPAPSDWWWGGAFIQIPGFFSSSLYLAYPSPIIWILYAWYYTFFTRRFGATPGKMMKGLVVLNTERQPPELKRAFYRWLGTVFSLIVLGAGIWWYYRKYPFRTWGDALAHTRVYYFLPFES